MYIVFLTILLSAVSADKLTVPAEWRVSQNGTWVAWPVFTFLNDVDPRPQFTEMIAYISQSEMVNILIQSQEQKSEAEAYISVWNKDNSHQRVNRRNLAWFNIPHSDFWLRDYLLFGRNNRGKLNVVQFAFNEWGCSAVSNYFASIVPEDGQIATRIGESIERQVVYTDLTMEAGGLEFNDESDNPNYKKYGRRLIVSEAVILQRQRTDFRKVFQTKRQVNDELNRLFNLDDIIWLPLFRYNRTSQHEYTVPQCDINDVDPLSYCNIPSSWYYYLPSGGGLVADESPFTGPQLSPVNQDDMVLGPITTNGHTDEYVKWVGPNHVILAYVPGDTDPDTMEGRTQYRLEQIAKIIKSKGITIYLVPTAPETVFTVNPGAGAYEAFVDMTYVDNGPYWDCSNLVGQLILSIYPKDYAKIVPARSYMNVIITNKNVLLAAYGDKTRDKEALNVFRQAFEAPGNPTGRVRKVVQIFGLDSINAGGGGMHCITQNQPVE